MPSPSAWRWLLKKEWRELMSSRSWWVMLALVGPLVGVSFISAVRSYAEASGQGDAAAGLADALFPLDGIVAPTFSAYEIAASFLLPFVAIRAIASDRTSGAPMLPSDPMTSAFFMCRHVTAARALRQPRSWEAPTW